MAAIHDSDSGGGYEIFRTYGEGVYGQFSYGNTAYINLLLLDFGTGSEAQSKYTTTPTDSNFGIGSETQFINVSSFDSGTGTDASLPVVVVVTSFDSGTGSEAVPGLVASVPIANSDSGTGSEGLSSLSISVLIAGSDFGTGSDYGFVDTPVSAVFVSDSATGSDAGFTPTPFSFDSGVGIDIGSLYLSNSDSGTGADASRQIASVLGASDSGTGADASLQVVVVTFDSGTGSDSASQQSASPFSSDSAIGADSSLPVVVKVVDSGTGTEAGIPHLSGSDSGIGTDTSSPPVIFVTGSDLAVGTDFVSGLVTGVARVVTDSDSGVGSEIIKAASGIKLSSSDFGYHTAIHRVISGISLVQSNSVNSGAVLKTSQVITLPAGIGLGNLVVVSVGDGNNNSFTAITGPTTGPWLQAVVNNPSGPVETSIWYMVVSPATAGQTTWTFTSSVSVPMALSIVEFKSIYGWHTDLSSDPLDQTAQGNVKPGVTTSSTADSGTTPQTAQIAEVWVASHTYVGASSFTTATPWTALSHNLGSGVSLSQLFLNADFIGSANCSISMATPPQLPQSWAGCVATFMPWIPVYVSSQDSGQGYDSPPFGSGADGLPYITLPGMTVTAAVSLSDVDFATGSETHAAGPGASLVKSDSDLGIGWDGSLDAYGTGLYGTGFYSPSLYIPIQRIATGTATSEYATGTDNVHALYGAPGPALSAAVLGGTFEGFSLSRAAILGSTGAESGQLYAAQTISLVPNVTATAMQEDDWDSGVWYTMDKANLTVTNGFMSWNTISSLTGIPVSSFGTSPNDYYGLPLWTQQQHNLPSVPMALRMSARNALSSVRTLDLLLYKVQLAVADFTGMVYKQGLGVSYAGTVLFSSADERGNALQYPQIGRIVSLPGTRQGRFTSSAYA